MQHEYEKAGAALAALDFSDANARVAAIREDMDKAERGIELANARVIKISQTLAEWRGPSGQDVARALIESGDVALAARTAPDEAELRAEREALQAGTVELRRAIEDGAAEIERIRFETSAKLAAATADLSAAIMDEAREAALRLLECYAAAKALSWGVRAYDEQARQLAPVATALTGSGRLIEHRRGLTVPTQMTALLQPLIGAEDAVRVRVMHNVEVY